MIVPRTCIEISAGDANQRQDKEPRPLEAFRDAPAYVLLGDPGAGKTTAFTAECAALGEQACLVTARDFQTFEPRHHPEWGGKTLFIDGLDEVRAGTSDARTPFDAIRGRLDALGQPRFRLSCREADWLGANDRNHLETVSPNGKVMLLRLNPLTDSDIVQLLAVHPRINDAEAFIAEADRRRIGDLLRNPQTLDLLAKAVVDGNWPESRQETFEMACARMVREHNDEHSAAMASSGPPAPDQLLDAAGRLCAVQLIAGKAGYTLHGQPDNEDEYPTPDQCGGDHPDRLRLALATKLFQGVSDNRFTPVHRHVAEFLGARYLANVIGDQTAPLPARRVIALITGADGGVVTELRGLSAWLAAHCQEARADLIERDPIGVGLYGDIRGLSLDEKRMLLESLGREGSPLGFTWRDATGFGLLLVTSDMEPAFRKVLNDSNRDQGYQVFIRFVLYLLTRGGSLPGLSEDLLGIVRDDTWFPPVNDAALCAFIHNCPDSGDKTGTLKALLADIHAGKVSDVDDELVKILLAQLYPDDLPPSDVWNYLSEKEGADILGFWNTGLVEKSSDEQVAELLDNLKDRLPGLQPVLHARDLNTLPLKLLARGLEAYGNSIAPERLYDWLSVGSSWRNTQTAAYGSKPIRYIRAWLEERPEVQKAIIMEGLSRFADFHDVYRRLYGASLPPDFHRWWQEQAVVKMNTKPRVAE